MPPATVELNTENFESVVSRQGIVLVDCWASWCHNCDEFLEAFRRTAERHHEHIFATLNTQGNRELCSTLDIQHVPCLLVYRDGLFLLKQPGSYDEATLDDIVGQAESLDMEAVRAEIESQEGDRGS